MGVPPVGLLDRVGAALAAALHFQGNCRPDRWSGSPAVHLLVGRLLAGAPNHVAGLVEPGL